MPDATGAVAPAASAAVPVVAGWLRARPAPPAGPRILAVDGRSGAGKSTFATALAGVLPATIVRLDDIYPGWDGLLATPPLVAEWVLRPLAEGRPAAHRRWDWAAGTWREGWQPVLPVPFVLVEGVGAGADVCRSYLTGLVWLELDDDLRRERAIARDGAVFAANWDRWAAQEQALLAADDVRAAADLVVDVRTGRVTGR